MRCLEPPVPSRLALRHPALAFAGGVLAGAALFAVLALLGFVCIQHCPGR